MPNPHPANERGDHVGKVYQWRAFKVVPLVFDMLNLSDYESLRTEDIPCPPELASYIRSKTTIRPGFQSVVDIAINLSIAEHNDEMNKLLDTLEHIHDTPANTDYAQLRAWRQERGS